MIRSLWPASVTLVVPPASPGVWPNREGAVGLGAAEADQGGFRYPPHTVATVAAVLRKQGIAVKAFDAVAMGWDVPQTVAHILDGNMDIVVVYVSWATRTIDEIFVAALRMATSNPIVVMGSSTFHMAPMAGVDYWLQGEPEWSLPTLLRRLGIGDIDQGIISTEQLGLSAFGQDLDALPIPAWDDLPAGRYSFLSVLSSRGCDRSCSWCPYTVAQGHTYRADSPERVVTELVELVKRYGPKRIVFRDPAFALDKKRVLAICKGILAEPCLAPGRNLLWECESHPLHFDRQLLQQMNLAGCVGIKVGLETVSSSILQREGRLCDSESARFYLEHVAKLVKTALRLGLACRLYVMVGLPGQNFADAQEMAGYLRRIKPTSVMVKRLKRYPGLLFSQNTLPSREEDDVMMGVLSEAQADLASIVHPSSSPIWRVWRKASQLLCSVRQGGHT